MHFKLFDFGTGSRDEVDQSSVSSFSSTLPQILYLQSTKRIMKQMRRKVTRGKRITLHSLNGSEVTVPLLTAPQSPITESSLLSLLRELVVSKKKKKAVKDVLEPTNLLPRDLAPELKSKASYSIWAEVFRREDLESFITETLECLFTKNIDLPINWIKVRNYYLPTIEMRLRPAGPFRTETWLYLSLTGERGRNETMRPEMWHDFSDNNYEAWTGESQGLREQPRATDTR